MEIQLISIEKKWKFGHFNSLSWPQKGDPISPKYTKICVFSFLTVLPSFFKAGWKMMDFSQKRWFWDILNMISQVGQFRSIHQNSHCTDFRQVSLRLGRQNSILWDWDPYYDIIMYHDQFRLKRYFFTFSHPMMTLWRGPNLSKTLKNNLCFSILNTFAKFCFVWLINEWFW